MSLRRGKITSSNVSAVLEKGSSGMQIFSTSGTFVVPNNISSVKVTMYGAGGGGGGAANYPNQGTFTTGGGGGAGGYFEAIVPVIPGASVTVTVGTGGTAGSNGAAHVPNQTAGSPGGSTSFDTIVLGGGGGGATGNWGAGGSAGTPGSGGAGATLTSSGTLTASQYITINGNNGGSGGFTSTIGVGGVKSTPASTYSLVVSTGGNSGSSVFAGTSGLVIVEY